MSFPPRVVIGCIWILFFVVPNSVNSQATNNFESLSHQILETLQSYYPVRATEMGIHTYDSRFTDYSSNAVSQMIKKLQDFEKQLYSYKDASLSDHGRINYQLIKSNVDIALLDLKRIEWYKKSPQLYIDEAVNGVYFLMLSNHAPLSVKVETITARMRAVPALLGTARKNIKKPPKVLIEGAKKSLEESIRFYQDIAGELMNKFPGRANEILQVSTAAREAMNDFAAFLDKLQPGAETAISIGKDNFEYKLTNEYFLSYGADSLLKLGEALFAQANEAYKLYELLVEDNNQNGNDSIFVPANFTKQDIIDYYNWETNQVRLFIEQNNLITVPADIAPVTVIETPPFLRSMISGIAYQPAGPFDSLQQAYFYVRPIPTDLDRQQLEGRYRYIHRRGFKGSVVHEAYPGHHLQTQIAGRNSDPVRKWQFNTLMIEGWALYCEEMMYQNGLYGESNHALWLRILGGIKFRAARIVADVKLHTGQLTYQQCVDWMIEALKITSDSEKEYIRTEVRRYLLTPGVQMSYLVGKEEITRLLEAAMQRDEESFDFQAFHDALLFEGSIPPTLMWEIMGLEK